MKFFFQITYLSNADIKEIVEVPNFTDRRYEQFSSFGNCLRNDGRRTQECPFYFLHVGLNKISIWIRTKTLLLRGLISDVSSF